MGGWRILQPLHSKYWGTQSPDPPFLSLYNFIMLVWVQGSVFQIAAGSHPEQEIWGSHDSLYPGLYRDQIQKLLRCCREPCQHATDSSCYNDSEKSIVWSIYDHDDVPFRSYWRKGQMLNFWLYRGQTGKNDPILLAMVSKCLSSKYNENYMRCFVTMVTQQKRSANGH